MMLGTRRRWRWLPLLVVSLMAFVLSLGAVTSTARACEMSTAAAPCPCSAASESQPEHPTVGRRSCCTADERPLLSTSSIAPAPEVEAAPPPVVASTRAHREVRLNTRGGTPPPRPARGPPLYLSNCTLLL